MGRPRRDYNPVVVHVGNFNLHPEHDKDLIEFFRDIPRRRRVREIKKALRAGGVQSHRQAEQVDLAELDAAAGAFL